METTRGLRVAGRDSERGIVLVIVIIIIAILMILVTDLIYFTQIDSEISMNTRDEVKARYIAKSGVQVAAGAFKATALEELSGMMGSVGGSAGNVDGLWALSVPYFPGPGERLHHDNRRALED